MIQGLRDEHLCDFIILPATESFKNGEIVVWIIKGRLPLTAQLGKFLNLPRL